MARSSVLVDSRMLHVAYLFLFTHKQPHWGTKRAHSRCTHLQVKSSRNHSTELCVNQNRRQEMFWTFAFSPHPNFVSIANSLEILEFALLGDNSSQSVGSAVRWHGRLVRFGFTTSGCPCQVRPQIATWAPQGAHVRFGPRT